MRNITLPYWISTQAKLAEGWSGPSILKLKLKPFSKHLKERSEAVCHPFSKQHLVQHQRWLSCDLSGRRPRRTKLSLGLYVVLLVFFIWILPLFSDQRHRIILLPATNDVMPGTTKFYIKAYSIFITKHSYFLCLDENAFECRPSMFDQSAVGGN